MIYKAIAFDYGGVLAGEPGSVFDNKASNILDVEVETFKEIYFRHNQLINTGGISIEDFWLKVVIDLDRVDKFQLFIDFIKNNPPSKNLNEQMIELVSNLKNHYQVVLLSNNSKKNANKMRGLGLDKVFDEFIISEEVGLIKPDRAIFEIIFNKLKILPQELIFIDDTQKSLSTANEIGYTPILFTGYDELIKELGSLEIITN